jgi:hypothetical protein
VKLQSFEFSLTNINPECLDIPKDYKCCTSARIFGETMKRKEAIALLKELSDKQLIQPTFVLIEQRKPDSFELEIKGNFDCQAIDQFVNNRFMVKENLEKGILIIF